MKNITFLFASFCSFGISFGQLFSENFDSYTVGSYLGPQSTSWSTWSGTEGNAEDVTITNNNANSAPHSIYLSSTATAGGPQDVILKFGQVYNSGIFTFESDFYVNSGKTAYFNFQATQTLGQTWALNVNLNAGNMFIDDGATSNLVVSTYPQATWFSLKIEANLTLHIWKAYLDGVLVGTWTNGINTLASTDFFPVTNSQFYVDDVMFNHVPYVLPTLNAIVSNVALGGEIAGQTATPVISIQNGGATAINSFDVSLSYNSILYNSSVSAQNIASIASYNVTMPSFQLVPGNQTYTVVISNINGGNDDIAEDNTLFGSINPVVPAPGKMVVSEEATGTWCQWCPRGAVFMDQFNTKYNQFWAGIAVHNGDPMTVVEYDSGIGAFIGGYPSAIVDRGTDVDPSGMSPEFFARLQIPPVATLINGATWDPTSRILNVSVKADFALAANSSYKLACVLTEDDVTGTGSAYNQSNAYAGGGNGVMGGFELLPSSVPAAQMVYDHVARAIAPSFTGEANSFPATVLAGQSYTLNFSFTLPATWDENSINIIGLLLDPQGRIDNAGKATIAEAVANGYVAGLSTIYGDNLEKMVTVYPNPASSMTTIHLNLESQASVVLSLLDVSGKVLSSKNYESLNGSRNLDLNTSNYTSGVYFISVLIDGNKITKQLIIE
jgi:hypothetical protein